MKEKQGLSGTSGSLWRDLVVLAGIGLGALLLGIFTPLFEWALGWIQPQEVLETLVGVGLSLAVAATVLRIRRGRDRSAHLQAPAAPDTSAPLATAKMPEGTPPSPVATAPPAAAPTAVFPEHNPHPILEVDPAGTVYYANPVARRLFPDLEARGQDHPILSHLTDLLGSSGEEVQGPVVRDVWVAGSVYERQAVALPQRGRLRLYLHDVTQHSLTEAALRRSEEKFKHAFRSAPLAISINRLADGRFLDVNDHFLQLLGYEDRHQVLGHTASALGIWATPGNRARVLDFLTEDESGAHRYEAQVFTTTDTVRDVIVSVVALEVDGEACILSALLDVTKHREAEAGMETLKAFYENTLRDLPIEVTVLDDEARFIYLNPAAHRDEEWRFWMFGKTSVDYALARDLDPTPYQKRHAWLLDVIASKEIGQLEETLQTPDGETHHMLRVAMPVLDDDDDIIYVVGYGLDVTERKTFERQLVAAKSAAEEMARLKTSFVANMSHEVRTPLTAILGFASVLGEELDGEQRELAEIIKQSGERLLETLNSVLDLARLEAEALHIDPRALNLNEELTAAARLFGPMAEKKNLSLILNVPDLPIWAPLDRAYLHRVLSNLLSNAIKFTEVGWVQLILKSLDTEVLIEVRDTGIGIAESFQPYLFEEFKQESTGLSRTHTGSGLGLAITQHLVNQMQGRIEVESIKGQGTTFSVTFPVAPEAEDYSEERQQLDLFMDTETESKAAESSVSDKIGV